MESLEGFPLDLPYPRQTLEGAPRSESHIFPGPDTSASNGLPGEANMPFESGTLALKQRALEELGGTAVSCIRQKFSSLKISPIGF